DITVNDFIGYVFRAFLFKELVLELFGRLITGRELAQQYAPRFFTPLIIAELLRLPRFARHLPCLARFTPFFLRRLSYGRSRNNLLHSSSQLFNGARRFGFIREAGNGA